jgi:hypothetical protein
MFQAVSARRAVPALSPWCRIEDDIVLASDLLPHKLQAECLRPGFQIEGTRRRYAKRRPPRGSTRSCRSARLAASSRE